MNFRSSSSESLREKKISLYVSVGLENDNVALKSTRPVNAGFSKSLNIVILKRVTAICKKDTVYQLIPPFVTSTQIYAHRVASITFEKIREKKSSYLKND